MQVYHQVEAGNKRPGDRHTFLLPNGKFYQPVLYTTFHADCPPGRSCPAPAFI